MSDLEIREQVGRYVAGEIDAPALEDVLEDACWDAAGPAASLGENALRLLAEYANGDWTDDELRERLRGVSDTYRLEQPPRLVSSGADAHVIREDQRSAAVGRWRVAESV